jgi:hypothetical protein
MNLRLRCRGLPQELQNNIMGFIDINTRILLLENTVQTFADFIRYKASEFKDKKNTKKYYQIYKKYFTFNNKVSNIPRFRGFSTINSNGKQGYIIPQALKDIKNAFDVITILPKPRFNFDRILREAFGTYANYCKYMRYVMEEKMENVIKFLKTRMYRANFDRSLKIALLKFMIEIKSLPFYEEELNNYKIAKQKQDALDKERQNMAKKTAFEKKYNVIIVGDFVSTSFQKRKIVLEEKAAKRKIVLEEKAAKRKIVLEEKAAKRKIVLEEKAAKRKIALAEKAAKREEAAERKMAEKRDAAAKRKRISTEDKAISSVRNLFR